MIKDMGQKAREMLLDIYNEILKEEIILKDWHILLLVPIYKKKETKKSAIITKA